MEIGGKLEFGWFGRVEGVSTVSRRIGWVIAMLSLSFLRFSHALILPCQTVVVFSWFF